jgi:hypothetical protein
MKRRADKAACYACTKDASTFVEEVGFSLAKLCQGVSKRKVLVHANRYCKN